MRLCLAFSIFRAFPGELELVKTPEDADDAVTITSGEEEHDAVQQVTVPQEDAPSLALSPSLQALAPMTPCRQAPSLAQAPMSQALALQTPCKPAPSLVQAPMSQALAPQTADSPDSPVPESPECAAPDSPVPPLPDSFFARLPEPLPMGGGARELQASLAAA